MAPAIKQKVHSLPGIEYLYAVMSPEQLEIPAFITEYDMTVSLYCTLVRLEFHTYVLFLDKWYKVFPTSDHNITETQVQYENLLVLKHFPPSDKLQYIFD